MGVIASEEEDTPVDVLDDEGLGTYATAGLMDETGRYTAVFDPLDGSSNVDAGIPTGTIFGIFEDTMECEVLDESCDEDEEQSDENCEVRCAPSPLPAQCTHAVPAPLHTRCARAPSS